MQRLKLAALDAEDLGVISAHVQDAVMKVSDIKYSAADHRMVLQFNRFVWETADKGQRKRSYERRLCILHFERVDGVRANGIDQLHGEGILNLLSIRFLPFDNVADDPSGEVELAFAGEGTLRLLVECVEAQLSDLDASWETRGRPKHDI